ncbi:MAG: tetratricopeptide repeat protein [Syntrophales bacterium]|nr:tetratricopeptide repeat protein [Syntrophales bacterium]
MKIIICLLLVIVTLTAYWAVQSYDFVTFDDPVYVTENHHVQSGLTRKNLNWALLSLEAGFWHPLTWMSFLIDFDLYGLNPGGYHWTNLLWHIANTMLVFLVFMRMTTKLWQSAVVALLFALHPLHVESVAWISARKDVLSTFFWLLTMLIYIEYAAHGGKKRYALTMLAFICGLMAKPMLVTLPFVLLLLDYWPLGRYPEHFSSDHRKMMRLMMEKGPFIILGIASIILTFFAERQVGAIKSLDTFPWDIRLANGLISYTGYLGKMLWPSGLSVFYPHPGMWPFGLVILSASLLGLISLLVFRLRKNYPYLIIGWLWYLIVLAPVIGIIQVGLHASADRYTYVSALGIFLMGVWGVADILDKCRCPKMFAKVIMTAMTLLLIILTRQQASYWQNSVTLYKRAIEVTTGNYVALNNLGAALLSSGQPAEALTAINAALHLKPDFAQAYNNMGIAYRLSGQHEAAVKSFLRAIEFKKNFADAHYNLGNTDFNMDNVDAAIRVYRKSLELHPLQAVRVHIALGLALARQNNLPEAVSECHKALALMPGSAEAHNVLGMLLAQQGKYREAMQHYVQAVESKPDFADAYNNMGIILALFGKHQEAEILYKTALRIRPGYKEAEKNLQVLQGKIKRERRR